MSGSTTRRDGRIDWSAVRARMEHAEASLREALDPSPERAAAIMNARAEALARVPPKPPGAQLDVVLFGLGKERYAIETRFVREAIRLADFTPVPGTPDFILGVTNLRGSVLAVVDFRRLLDIEQKGLTDLSRVIVLGTDRAEFGILADEAHGQTDIAVDDVLDPPGSASGIGRAYLRGVTSDALIILDGAALFADPRLTVEGERKPGA